MTGHQANGGGNGQNDWWAVYTRHQHERTVAGNLSENGIETFLPTYQVVRQWKDRKKHLSLPLFPCYLFVRAASDRRTQVLSAPGVYCIVSAAGHPAPVPAIQIEAIQRAVGSSLPVEPHPFLHCGDWVRIKAGPLANVEGILLRKKGSCRLILSAELLQKSLAVEVDAFNVEPLSRRADTTKPPNLQTPVLVHNPSADWLLSDHREYGERLS